MAWGVFFALLFAGLILVWVWRSTQYGVLGEQLLRLFKIALGLAVLGGIVVAIVLAIVFAVPP
jgi:hypothetical protein